jgi:ribosome-binding factor A
MRYRKNRTNDGDHPSLVDPMFARALTGSTDQHAHQRKQNHKDQMLCRQVQRALNLALAGGCGDDVLRELYVVDVTPAPSATHLLVQVSIPASIAIVDVLERLSRAMPRLRAEVARSITRKRAPELSFIPAPAAEAPQEQQR